MSRYYAVLCYAVLYLLRCKITKETVIFIFHSVSAVRVYMYLLPPTRYLHVTAEGRYIPR